MKNLGIMQAELSLIGQNFDPEKISEMLDIKSTHIDKHKKNNAWIWKSDPIECIGTNTALMILVETFSSKVSTIFKLCNSFYLEAHIKIYVEILGGELPDPEIGLEIDGILFANKIQSDIEIIMVNWPEISMNE